MIGGLEPGFSMGGIAAILEELPCRSIRNDQHVGRTSRGFGIQPTGDDPVHPTNEPPVNPDLGFSKIHEQDNARAG